MWSQKKDYIWNSLGSLLQSAISPILLIVITRLNGIEDSGLFSFAMSISIVFWAVSLWGGRTYQVSDVKREFSSGGYIAVRFVASLVVAISAIVFCILNGYNTIKTGLIMILVGFKILESISDSLHGILQIHGRLYIAGISLTMKSVFGFGIFMLVDILTKNIIYGVLAILLVNLLIIIFYDIPWMRRVENVAINKKLFKKYLSQAVVIMKRTSAVFVVVLLTMFSLNIPRYFIDMYHSDENTYFGIMAMPITLVLLLMTFILQPNIVYVSKLLDQKKINEIKKVVTKVLAIVVLIGSIIIGCTWLVGADILSGVFGFNFSERKYQLVIMVTGGVVNAGVAVLINLLTIMRRLKEQLIIQVLTNVVLAVLSTLLIPKWGLMASIWLFFITVLVQFIWLTIVWKLYLKKLTCGIIKE
jgi:transcriptional activator amrA